MVMTVNLQHAQLFICLIWSGNTAKLSRWDKTDESATVKLKLCRYCITPAAAQFISSILLLWQFNQKPNKSKATQLLRSKQCNTVPQVRQDWKCGHMVKHNRIFFFHAWLQVLDMRCTNPKVWCYESLAVWPTRRLTFMLWIKQEIVFMLLISS